MASNFYPNVPSVPVNIVPPQNFFAGVATNPIGAEGTASWGSVDSPTLVSGSNMQDYITKFGTPTQNIYDMGIGVYVCTSLGASSFKCLRVTDGTDTASFTSLLDSLSTPGIGALLTSIHTGSFGDTTTAVFSTGIGSTPTNPTYKITITMNNGVPEVFDGIGGSGSAFWNNLVNAINLGQSIARGKSQIVIASLFTGISGVTVTAGGTYTTTTPTATATVGTGAVLQPRLRLLGTPVLVAAGTGYTAGDTLTLSGGTRTTPATIIVDTVDGSGLILTFHVGNVGNYSVLPATAPASVTGGTGTGATFTINWEIFSIQVVSAGTGYNNTTVINITGSGGATATAQVGSSASPKLNTIFNLSGGTDGSDGVTSAELIGSSATNPPTGMYAFAGSKVASLFISNLDDPLYYSQQSDFSQQEDMYQISTLPPGYQDDVTGGITLFQNAGVFNPYFKMCYGDWAEIIDPFSNQNRFISTQSFAAALFGTTDPDQVCANKVLPLIINTQKSSENRQYSLQELSLIAGAGMDLVTKGIPSSDTSFGFRFGINTSSNIYSKYDSYSRMNIYLSESLKIICAPFLSQPMTNDWANNLQNAQSAFLQNVSILGWIGILNPTNPTQVPFSVILDLSQQNQGIVTSNVNVHLWGISQQIIVNLNANSGVTINTLTPQAQQ